MTTAADTADILEERVVRTRFAATYATYKIWLIKDQNAEYPYTVALVYPANNNVREEWNYDTLAEARAGVSEMAHWVKEEL